MGLTLNTDSLNVASASGGASGGGVSTSDVTTLIKNNTPYQFLTKVPITASVSTIDCSNVFSASDGFSTYHILFDRVTTVQNESYIHMRLEIGGSFVTSEYGWSIARGASNNNQTYEYNDNRWKIINTDISLGFTGYINVSQTDSGLPTISSWNIGSGHSTRRGSYSVGGGAINNTNECTGFRIFTSSNDFTAGGNIRIYGVNNV